MAYELVVEGHSPKRLKFEAPLLDDETLLNRKDGFIQRLLSFVLHIQSGTGCWVNLTDITYALSATTFFSWRCVLELGIVEFIAVLRSTFAVFGSCTTLISGLSAVLC